MRGVSLPRHYVVLCIARPSAQSELFICALFQWQMDTEEHELSQLGFYIPLIRDQDISGDPKTRTTIRNTHTTGKVLLTLYRLQRTPDSMTRENCL